MILYPFDLSSLIYNIISVGSKPIHQMLKKSEVHIYYFLFQHRIIALTGQVATGTAPWIRLELICFFHGLKESQSVPLPTLGITCSNCFWESIMLKSFSKSFFFFFPPKGFLMGTILLHISTYMEFVWTRQWSPPDGISWLYTWWWKRQQIFLLFTIIFSWSTIFLKRTLALFF